MRNKNRYLLTGVTAVLLSAAVLTGCSSKEERLEKETAYRQIGINAMEEGKYKEAEEAFNNALNQASGFGVNEVDICYYKAAAQFASGNLNAAEETYNALLEHDEESSDAYFLRGCVFLKNNESEKALFDFENAVKYAENDEMYLEVYNTLAAEGYEKEGADFLSEAIEKKAGRTAKNYTVKGRIYMLKEEYKKAAEQFEKAIEKGDDEAELYLAKLYEATGEEKKARACVDSYIEKNKESSVAYNKEGCVKLQEGSYQEAIEIFRKGLALPDVTNEREIRRNLIAAYEYSGDFKTAKEEMTSYLSDYPDDTAAARENLFLTRGRKDGNESSDTE